MGCFASCVFSGHSLDNFWLSPVSGPFAKISAEHRWAWGPRWWSRGTRRLSFSKVCHFSRLAARFWTGDLLRIKQLLHVHQGGGDLCWHTIPSPHLEPFSVLHQSWMINPWCRRCRGSTHEMQVLPSAASRAARPESCSTPLLWVRGRLSAHLAYITPFLWIGERMCLKTGIYILPLPTPSPWGWRCQPPACRCARHRRRDAAGVQEGLEEWAGAAACTAPRWWL